MFWPAGAVPRRLTLGLFEHRTWETTRLEVRTPPLFRPGRTRGSGEERGTN